jgi:hypothetical protein
MDLRSIKCSPGTLLTDDQLYCIVALEELERNVRDARTAWEGRHVGTKRQVYYGIKKFLRVGKIGGKPRFYSMEHIVKKGNRFLLAHHEHDAHHNSWLKALDSARTLLGITGFLLWCCAPLVRLATG